MPALRNRCELCGKKPMVGNRISHAHNVNKRRFFPNIHRIRALVNGAPRYLHLCTRCLRSGKVQKAL